MTDEESPLPERPGDIQSAVVKALVQAHMPQDVDAPASTGALLGVDLDQQAALPPLLERGLAQSGISTTELWVKTLALEVTIKYLERDIVRLEDELGRDIARLEDHLGRDIARLGDQIQAVDDKRWSEGRIIAVVGVVVALIVAVAKLVG